MNERAKAMFSQIDWHIEQVKLGNQVILNLDSIQRILEDLKRVVEG